MVTFSTSNAKRKLRQTYVHLFKSFLAGYIDANDGRETTFGERCDALEESGLCANYEAAHAELSSVVYSSRFRDTVLLAAIIEADNKVLGEPNGKTS